MPESIRIFVSQFSTFPSFIFSSPALFDPDLRFPIFHFPKFPLFLPPSRHFAPFAVKNVLALPKPI